MSKESLEEANEPWHRQYRKKLWFHKKPIFDEDNGPHKNLFEDKFFSRELRGMLHPSGDEFQNLKCELKELALDYLSLLHTTPNHLGKGVENVDYSKRVRWLEANILNPSAKLLDALVEENYGLLSPLPDKMNVREPTLNLIKQLNILHEYYDELLTMQNDRMDSNDNLKNEILLDMGVALKSIFEKYYPNYSTTASRFTTKESETRNNFEQFVRECIGQIIGSKKQVSGYFFGLLNQNNVFK